MYSSNQCTCKCVRHRHTQKHHHSGCTRSQQGGIRRCSLRCTCCVRGRMSASGRCKCKQEVCSRRCNCERKVQVPAGGAINVCASHFCVTARDALVCMRARTRAQVAYIGPCHQARDFVQVADVLRYVGEQIDIDETYHALVSFLTHCLASPSPVASAHQCSPHAQYSSESRSCCRVLRSHRDPVRRCSMLQWLGRRARLAASRLKEQRTQLGWVASIQRRCGQR